MIDWRRVGTVSVFLLFAGSAIIASPAAFESDLQRSLCITQSIGETERITIEGDWDLLDWPGTGTEEDPIVIQGLTIRSHSYCISISSTTYHFVIRDCILEASTDALAVVSFESVVNGAIEDCNVSLGETAVSIRYSSNCRVAGCDISSYEDGIHLDWSSNCTLSGNRVHGGQQGIDFRHATNCTIVSNDVFANDADGITLNVDSANNTVYSNAIGWNAISSSVNYKDARDDGRSNRWDNGTHGNLWAAGVSGGNRRIYGDAIAVDTHPSELSDGDSPAEILSPGDLMVPEQTRANVTWSAVDRFPMTYRLLVDGVPLHEGRWCGGNVTALISLAVGDHYLAMWFIDCSGNQVSVTTTFRVMWGFFGGLGTVTVFVSSLMSAVIVVLALVIVKRFR